MPVATHSVHRKDRILRASQNNTAHTVILRVDQLQLFHKLPYMHGRYEYMYLVHDDVLHICRSSYRYLIYRMHAHACDACLMQGLRALSSRRTPFPIWLRPYR